MFKFVCLFQLTYTTLFFAWFCFALLNWWFQSTVPPSHSDSGGNVKLPPITSSQSTNTDTSTSAGASSTDATPLPNIEGATQHAQAIQVHVYSWNAPKVFVRVKWWGMYTY